MRSFADRAHELSASETPTTTHTSQQIEPVQTKKSHLQKASPTVNDPPIDDP
jgi:hypothetical protein